MASRLRLRQKRKREVGHEPYLSELIAVLVAGDLSMSINLKKGGLCWLSIDTLVYDKCATLERLVMPTHLARMGQTRISVK